MEHLSGAAAKASPLGPGMEGARQSEIPERVPMRSKTSARAAAVHFAAGVARGMRFPGSHHLLGNDGLERR